MSNIIKIMIIVLSMCYFQFLFGNLQENYSVTNLTRVLDEAPYNSEIMELNKNGSLYILTQTIWANSSRSSYAAIIFPKSQGKKIHGINNFLWNENAELFRKRVEGLIEKAKKLPKGLISGIDLVKNTRRTLPFVLTRISISDGKNHYYILLNEISYIWELHSKKIPTQDNNINNINVFLQEYINIMIESNATKILDSFSPAIKYN